MSVYNLSKYEERSYNILLNAIATQNMMVRMPIQSGDAILGLYNKAISESRNGFLYRPGSIMLFTTVIGRTLKMETAFESQDHISFCSQIEFETLDIIMKALKHKSIYDKILYVYKYFIDNFTYCKAIPDDYRYHMTSSPFLYRKAVCEGFAFAFSHIINRMGIKCGIISGESMNEGGCEPHVWNIIGIGDKYYHIDVTGDICNKTTNTGEFDYFMLDDEIVAYDHCWNDYSIPKCNDPTMDYYYKKHFVCKSLDDAIDYLKKQLGLRRKIIALRCCKECFNNVISVDYMELIKVAMNRCDCRCSEIYYFENRSTGTVVYQVGY